MLAAVAPLAQDDYVRRSEPTATVKLGSMVNLHSARSSAAFTH
jgi:hypothetical protein